MIRVAVHLTVVFSAMLTIEGNPETRTGSSPETLFDFKFAVNTALLAKEALRSRILSTTRYFEDECEYVKAMHRYGLAIEKAIEDCSVGDDVAQLDSFEETYEATVLECFDELTTLSTFDKMVDEHISDILTIETNAKTQTEACKDDDKCKQEVSDLKQEVAVSEKTHQAMKELYDDKIPKLKLTYATTVNESVSRIQECLSSKLSNGLQEINKGIEKVQQCLDGLSSQERENKADSDEEDSEEKKEN